jgi:hypothetical protein
MASLHLHVHLGEQIGRGTSWVRTLPSEQYGAAFVFVEKRYGRDGFLRILQTGVEHAPKMRLHASPKRRT